ncbi:TPA: hypothetical protein ACIIU3_003353 [Serratia marcescens]
MKNIVENQYIKIDNSDFSFLTNQKPWLKIPADGSPLTFTGNADEAAKEFFNALIRVRDGYISALKAERDALAVENAEMRGVIDAAVAVANNSAGIAGWHLNGEIAGWDEILPELNIETPATDAALAAIQAQAVESKTLSDALSLISRCYKHSPHIQSMCVVETPATDAALAAIQAQGVEKFADMCREKSKLATTADSCAGWKNCSVHASSFAIRLREAK